MAMAKVDNICPICEKLIEPGIAIYLTKVNLTDSGRSGPGDGGMYWGGAFKHTPPGKLRIQYLGSSKPRVCMHPECYEQKVAAAIFGKKKK